MDVASWLRSLNLGQYEAVFRESEIDADILPELTDQDLEKLGVPLGHRKRLLKAIAKSEVKHNKGPLRLLYPSAPALMSPNAVK